LLLLGFCCKIYNIKNILPHDWTSIKTLALFAFFKTCKGQHPAACLTANLRCCKPLFVRAACTLSAIHFLTAAASVIGAQLLGFTERAKLPLKGEGTVQEASRPDHHTKCNTSILWCL
jgi:hypothetical protein